MSSQNTALNGAWSGTVQDSGGQTTMTFDFSMMGGSGSMMSVSGLQMTMATACFGAGATLSAQMGGGMMGAGGTMTMDLWSGPGQTGNHLHMEVTMNAGMTGGSGTYTLTGTTPDCTSASGTFSMVHK